MATLELDRLTAADMEKRIVRYGDLRPCKTAFIDAHTPGSDQNLRSAPQKQPMPNWMRSSPGKSPAMGRPWTWCAFRIGIGVARPASTCSGAGS